VANPFVEKNINFKVYMDGESISHAMATLTLPNIAMMTETLSGSGIAGELESPTMGHTQNIQVVMNFRKMLPKHLTTLDGDFHLFDCRYVGQIKDGDTGAITIDKVSVAFRGVVSEVNLGTISPGASQEASITVNCSDIMIEYDGAKQYDIGKLDMKYAVMKNGTLTDLLEGARSFLG